MPRGLYRQVEGYQMGKVLYTPILAQQANVSLIKCPTKVNAQMYVGQVASIPQNNLTNNFNMVPFSPSSDATRFSGIPSALPERHKHTMVAKKATILGSAHTKKKAPLQGTIDVPPSVCPVCRKNFSKRGNMLIHLRIHMKEKPFACRICKRKFTQKNSMQRHLRTHTGEKPFACPVCHKKFAVKSNIKSHIRTHTGEKPFVCPFCPKKFAQQQNLKSHIRVHTRKISCSSPVVHKTAKNCIKKHSAYIDKTTQF